MWLYYCAIFNWLCLAPQVKLSAAFRKGGLTAKGKQEGKSEGYFHPMSEWKARLSALHQVLLPHFPKELLPIINDYIKAKSHEWWQTKDFPGTITKTHVQISSTTYSKALAQTKYWLESGPCDWAVDCNVSCSDGVWESEIEVGMFCTTSGDQVERIELAIVRGNYVNLLGFNGNGGISIRFEENENPRVVIQVNPEDHLISTSYENQKGVDSRKTRNDRWCSYKPYVALRGNASVELITI